MGSPVVNLTDLAATRAKMTLATTLIECCSDQPESHPCRLVFRDDNTLGFSILPADEDDVIAKADVHGIVATHNAADVLIEVARTAIAADAALVAFEQWRPDPARLVDDDFVSLLKAAREARAAHREALAKVSL